MQNCFILFKERLRLVLEDESPFKIIGVNENI